MAETPTTASPARARTPHTQVPNLVADLIVPLLSGAEVGCLLYIVRRTYGFVSADGQRKQRDRISLSQFENGIESGGYVLDLGTGLSRQTVITSLRKLEEKGLVRVDHHCARCLWEPTDSSPDPVKGACPRCQKTLDRSYGMVELTPRIVTRFLNEQDPKRRRWVFDAEVRRFRVETAAPVAAPVEASPLSDFIERLWYPELVAKVIEQLVVARKGKPMADQQIVSHVYRPVLEMQERSSRNAAALKHALEETLGRKIPQQVRETKNGEKVTQKVNYRWWAYAKAVLERSLAKPAFSSASSAPGAPATADPMARARSQEQGARDLLGRARELNQAGDLEAARAVLSELLGMSEDLAPLFEGAAERADAHIRSAFKKGTRDLATAPRAAAIADYYPEWDWPEGLSK